MEYRNCMRWLLLAILGTLPCMACAAGTSGWFLSLGAFDPKASTNIRLDAMSGQLGTNLHLESDLALPDRRVVPQAELGYRFDRRSSLELDYFELNRTGSHVINESITYGGANYSLNTTVSTFSDVRTEFLRYRYTFMVEGPFELSLAAGLHTTHFSVGLSDLNTGVSRSADADAPLPLVGLRGQYRVAGWQFRADANYFKMTVNGVRGHLNDYTLSIAHPLFTRLSLELGYTRYVLALDAARPNLTGQMRFAYQGPFLNLCYGCQPGNHD